MIMQRVSFVHFPFCQFSTQVILSGPLLIGFDVFSGIPTITFESSVATCQLCQLNPVRFLVCFHGSFFLIFLTHPATHCTG